MFTTAVKTNSRAYGGRREIFGSGPMDLKDAEDADQTGPEDQQFGIITKFLVFRAKQEEPRMSHAHFVGTVFSQSGCSSSRALAYVLGRPFLEQTRLGGLRTNIRVCVPVLKDNDNSSAQFKTTQKF